jgi:hypothetical protein
MSALIKQVAVVSLSPQVPPATVMRVSGALQKQATRDLAPIWEVSATVDAFDSLGQVPVGSWPIIIGGNVPPGAGGFHTDKNGQPLAIVRASSDINVLCQTCSHEMIEMLVDPFGSRFVPGDSPMPNQGRVNFLVEACDPSEAAEFGYTINNLLVSDFYTPHFFDPVQSAGVRYSFTGAITEPRQVLQGGYLSWQDPISKHFFQERRIETIEPDFEVRRQALATSALLSARVAIGVTSGAGGAAGLSRRGNFCGCDEPLALLNTSRRSVSEQDEHCQVWCS